MSDMQQKRRSGRSLLGAVMLTAAVAALPALGLAEGQRPRNSAFPHGSPSLQTAGPAQHAVYAVFSAATCITQPCAAGELDTAISITNTLAGPPGIVEAYEQRFQNLEGTVELYFWDTYGHLLVYETQAGSPGIGLVQEPGKEGFLTPGRTWRVLLSELLTEIDYAQHEVDFNHAEGVFAGSFWVVANFNGVQGTTNLTDFATFTQSLVLQPDLGTTFYDFDANAGVPIPPVNEPETP